MKRILIACAAMLTAPAAAQTMNDNQRDAVADAQSGPPVMLAGYYVPRDMPIAPVGVNQNMREVPAAVAARVLEALETYDYPRCSMMIEDRCKQ